ncbi:MAG: hypothetical protein HS126_22660 [Anaerolineales bacterium]|nr:hypothetical protein [Anaerolineales bacterium]
MARIRIRGLNKSGLANRLLALALFLTGVGGAFLPWIWRPPVALQLTAPGLAEFVKFLPEVRYGQVQIQRLFFLLPLFFAMLALPVTLEIRTLALPRWLCWALRLAVAPFALAALPPVWTPTILIAPEFRLQTGLALTAGALALLAPLLKNLPLKIVTIGLVGGGLAAVILPLWHFSLVQPGIVEAYHQPVLFGWGWWVTAGGLIGSSIGGVWLGRAERQDRG